MKKRSSPRGIASKNGARHDRANQVAAEALAFLAEEPERLERFFDLTGLSVATLRQAAGSPGFTASLLDYLGSDEPLLLAFASRHGYDPAEIDAVRLDLSRPNRED